jgi:Flp pilus assembly protein TadG
MRWQEIPPKGERGSNTIELAILLPLVLVLLIGMLQLGIYMYGLSLVENAARNAGRAGSVAQACPVCEAQSSAYASLNGAAVISNFTITVLAPGGVVGSSVRIRVSARLPMLVPGGAALGLEPLMTVTAEATFRQEGW